MFNRIFNRRRRNDRPTTSAPSTQGHGIRPPPTTATPPATNAAPPALRPATYGVQRPPQQQQNPPSPRQPQQQQHVRYNTGGPSQQPPYGAPAPPPVRVAQPPVQQQQQHQQQQQQPPPYNNDDDDGPPSHATGENGGNATEATRDLVRKFIADIWNRGELDLIPDVVSPSLRFNGNNGFDRVGHEGLARMVATIRDALDDYHCEIHSMVVEGNKAFCRLRFTGKHTGPLLGFGPTNRVVAWMGATEFTVQRGKILKVWELGDVKSLEEQLGAEPPEEEEV